ncbi:MAG: hypothetical protein QOH04_1002 [Sphingomonadales bacterium]|jgi:hypothetical protein|nr:hypothetical protein [Sphingomonadales bacterium]
MLLATPLAWPAAAAGRTAFADLGAPARLPELHIVDDCRAKDESGSIVVCGRRGEARYRLPLRQESFDPDGGVESVSRERHSLMEGGEAGIGSCSTVGPGGWTGCFSNTVKRRQQQSAGR